MMINFGLHYNHFFLSLEKQLQTKTGKAVASILGTTEDVVKLDRYKHALALNPKSRYCQSR